MDRPGTLYGIGVGPGDPELLTRRAARLLATLPVIAYPAAAGQPSLARAIAAACIGPACEEIALEMPMTVARGGAQAVYDAAAARIGAHLAQGTDVGVLCEGDPLFYGSFMYLLARLGDRGPVEVVPGVSSLVAAAAALRLPLVARNEVLTVIPGPLPDAELAPRLRAADSVAILKVGRHLPRLRALIGAMGLLDRAYYVERASQADQRALPLAQAPAEAPYFAMVLILAGDDPFARPGTRGLPVAAPPETPACAVLCLGPSGLATARAAAEALGAPLHGLASRLDPGAVDVAFDDTTAHIAALFAAGTGVVGVCAAGILIRAVSPLLGDKRAEPPVLAVAERSGAVVPLLGGHRGANALAARLAAALGGTAAITTAGDVTHGVALDAPPPGWVLGNPEAAKTAMAALLAGGGAQVTGAPWLAALPPGDAVRLIGTAEPGVEDATSGGVPTLVYHPLTHVLGVGASRGCPPEELAALARDVLARAGVAPGAVAAVASLDLKADETAILALARALDRPLRLFDAAALEAETPRLATPSEVVFAEVGCHGVAEAAALASVGPAGVLVSPKRKSAHATVALARAPGVLTTLPGRARGRVALVGIGPGQANWRTPEASRMVAEADLLVGYGLYIDLLGPIARGKPRHDFPLGGETARCRFALETAATGASVALICSGDAGIYAMGALVYELLDRGDLGDAARRVEVVSAPGVSALQAAAARAGAPLGHDFCAISLSDLLTPRADILARIEAAAVGDFVIAFYNPVSLRRRDLLARAREILLGHRPADCPVLLARSLGRPDETVVLRTLATLEVDEVDMMTVVLVGSRQTRRVETGDGPRLYTPRGYGVTGAPTTSPGASAAGSAPPTLTLPHQGGGDRSAPVAGLPCDGGGA